MTLEEALSKPSISVPDAGRLFYGLNKNASYVAARRGDIQTIKMGGKLLVPVAAEAQKLGLQTTFGRVV